MKFNIAAFLLASGASTNAQFQSSGRRLATDNQSASANAQHPLFRHRRATADDANADDAVDPAIITAEDNGRALQDTTDPSLSMPMAIEFGGGAGVAGFNRYISSKDNKSGAASPTPMSDTMPFIINGDKMDPREHPYLVSLGKYKGEDYKHKCGGSKISDRAVLTAARKL